ncbi:hypothetical protein R3P38DRAFT_2782584 [Favolaschia claudopus]|uniref:Ribonuclease H1 N-terminal domain-containing protein n=1 Tax=Favolaschia claudopus TaxID=2862362 RepID=A0AAW0B1M4_9AGAR
MRSSPPSQPSQPAQLSLLELERLSANLSDDEVDSLIDRMGAASLIAQLPPALHNLVRHLAQDMAHEHDVSPPAAQHHSAPPVSQPMTAATTVEQEADYVDSSADSILDSESSVTTASYISAQEDSSSSSSESEVTTTAFNISDLDDSDSELPPSSPELPPTPPRPIASRSLPSTPAHRLPARPPPRLSPTLKLSGVGVVMTWFKAGALTQGVDRAHTRALSPRKRPAHPKRGAYTIFYGGEVGVFTHWPRVAELTRGHGVAIHQGFPDVAAAQAALEYARERGWTRDSTPPDSPAAPAPGNDENDNPLVVGSQDRCLNITGVSGSLFASYPTRAEADAAYTHAVDSHFMRSIPRTRLF